MAIKVKLQDSNVEVGGEFKSALAWIKAQAGRTYDPATKTWVMPQKANDFLKHCPFPTDYNISGTAADGRSRSGHQTRYGNRYSDSEWAYNKAAWKAESDVSSEFGPEYAALKAATIQKIQALVGDEQTARVVFGFIDGFRGLEEAEERGKIRFSSPERRAALYAVEDEYGRAWMEISSREQDAVAAEQERLAEYYGL